MVVSAMTNGADVVGLQWTRPTRRLLAARRNQRGFCEPEADRAAVPPASIDTAGACTLGGGLLETTEVLRFWSFGGFGGLEDWRIGGLEDWRIAGLEDWRIGGLEDWRIAGLQDWRIGELQDCRIGGLEDWRIEGGGLEEDRRRIGGWIELWHFWGRFIFADHDVCVCVCVCVVVGGTLLSTGSISIESAPRLPPVSSMSSVS
jgi:hypothetical protein